MRYDTLHYLTRADVAKRDADSTEWLTTTGHDGSQALGRAMIAEAEAALGKPAGEIAARDAEDDDFDYGAKLLVAVEAQGKVAYTWGCFAEE